MNPTNWQDVLRIARANGHAPPGCRAVTCATFDAAHESGGYPREAWVAQAMVWALVAAVVGVVVWRLIK